MSVSLNLIFQHLNMLSCDSYRANDVVNKRLKIAYSLENFLLKLTSTESPFSAKECLVQNTKSTEKVHKATPKRWLFSFHPFPNNTATE